LFEGYHLHIMEVKWMWCTQKYYQGVNLVYRHIRNALSFYLKKEITLLSLRNNSAII
jgi:hypothetical protein